MHEQLEMIIQGLSSSLSSNVLATLLNRILKFFYCQVNIFLLPSICEDYYSNLVMLWELIFVFLAFNRRLYIYIYIYGIGVDQTLLDTI